MPDRIEWHQHRRYEPTVCWLCDRQAVYRVTHEEDGPADELFACDEHNWNAFS